jgi:L-asparaginase
MVLMGSFQDNDKSIKILVTGGTFDKVYDELDGNLSFKGINLPDILKLSRCTLNVDIETLMLTDSLYMTGSDRAKILKKCLRMKKRRIIITHGTDTIVETAVVLAETIRDKTIVLTGAIIPYKFSGSDALFNFATSLAFVQTLPNGVYISMNGKCFDWDNVIKNKMTCEFEEKHMQSTLTRRTDDGRQES